MANVLLGRGYTFQCGEAEEKRHACTLMVQRSLFIQLHFFICEALRRQQVQSAFPLLIDLSGIHNEKADV